LLLAACGSRGGAEIGWEPVGASKEHLCRTFIDIVKFDNNDQISQAKMAGRDHPDYDVNLDIMPGGESYEFLVNRKTDEQLAAESTRYRAIAFYELGRRAKARNEDLVAIGYWARSAMPPSAELRDANKPGARYRFRKAQVMGAYTPSMCRLSVACKEFNPPKIAMAPACKESW
jgi:hypothetical protein